MNQLQGLGIEDKRAWMVGLAIGCPYEKPLETCPLNELRMLPLIERFQRVKKMDEREMEVVIAHHRLCRDLRA